MAQAFSLGSFAATTSFHVLGDDPGAWPQIFSSIGLTTSEDPGVWVVRPGARPSAAELLARIDRGALLVLEGESELATALGFRRGARVIAVRNLVDARRPALPIIWEKALDLPVFEIPKDARVFTRERWHSAPLLAGMRRGAGAVLWVAASPGERGFERFPYVLHALNDLGLEAPLRSHELWAFFDSSYRMRVDLDYLAVRWRQAGIAALHVAAWHYYEPDPQRDDYLRRLIEACHRNAILVYAWIELPHVSEKFWNDHPEWREKTALLQDAHLDWRKLMNLSSRECFAAAAAGIRGLLGRFAWDGVNLAELYFESLEGHANPARFTPLNDDVRREFRRDHGLDPLDLFRGQSADEKGLRAFLDYRAALARRMQEEWIAVLESERTDRPHMDLVLTHIDDRFDTRMRDLLGADATQVLPLLERHDFTFLIEDPATVWHLGPRRYPEIAARYRPLTPHAEKLAIDINIVERYQDVYPTKQQTGTELFQLVNLASRAFPRVALYFENSILAPDLPLLAASAANATRLERKGGTLLVDSPRGTGVVWPGPALVDGQPWPVTDGVTLRLPGGPHIVAPGSTHPGLRVLDFNGELRSAQAAEGGVELRYRSSSSALARLDRRPVRLAIDGARAEPSVIVSGDAFVLRLPRGEHQVRIE